MPFGTAVTVGPVDLSVESFEVPTVLADADFFKHGHFPSNRTQEESMNNNDKTIFSTTGSCHSLEEQIVMEVYKRGCTVLIGSARSPGRDRDLYSKLARFFGITESQKQEVNHHGKNRWDYTVLVAVQKLKDPARAGKKKDPELSLIISPSRGVWMLTDRGRCVARRLSERSFTAEQNRS